MLWKVIKMKTDFKTVLRKEGAIQMSSKSDIIQGLLEEQQRAYSVILPCAGVGSRMGLGYNKLLYVMKNKKTVIENTLDVFIEDNQCKEMIVCVSKEDLDVMKTICNHPKIKLVLGGPTRQASVYQGLPQATYEQVLIHDGARPYITQDLINRLLEKLQSCTACLPMVAVKDTIKEVSAGKVIKTPDRATLFQAQTPQAFQRTTILKAHLEAIKQGYEGTDDASLVEALLKDDVYMIEGSYDNIKITTPEDLF